MSKKLMLKSLRILTLALFVLYLLILVEEVILKEGMALSLADLGAQIPFSQKITQVNVIPFVNTILPYLKGEPSFRIAMENLLGNIAAFGPLGFFLPLLFKNYRKLKATFLLSLGASFFIELVQLIFYLGSCDIDDIILNVSRALLGYGVYYLLKSLYNSFYESREML